MKKHSKISISQHYELYDEDERLNIGLGKLEFERTKHILQKYLPPLPATVLDVGGATGPYSRWLAGIGYQVHLIEPSRKLLHRAKELSRKHPESPIASFTLSDAHSLDFPDNSIDTVLFFGPMYHIIDYDNRISALKESYRVLNKGGLLFVAAISRFASAIDGFNRGFFKDRIFTEIIKHDLENGQHRNPTENLEYFTDAFFHLPSKLKDEIDEAGFECEKIFPIESIAFCIKDFEDNWADNERRRAVIEIIERIEDDECILGATYHLLGVARKKSH